MNNTVLQNLIYNQLFAAANYELVATIAPNNEIILLTVVITLPILNEFIKKKTLLVIIQLLKKHNSMVTLLNQLSGSLITKETQTAYSLFNLSMIFILLANARFYHILPGY